MTIETKYNIGQKVWFYSLGIIKSATICNIRICVMTDNYIAIRYDLNKSGYSWERNEQEIYPTKEELLKSCSYEYI